MPRILAVLAGCSLVAGVLASPPVAAAPGTSATSAARTAGSYASVEGNPVRVLDTRTGLGGRLGAVASRHTVTAQVRPAWIQASAAVIEVIVPGNTPPGSLSVYPSGTSWDGRVTMSTIVGQQLTVRLGTDGGVTIRNNSATAVHLIVDVMGYYAPGTPTQPGTFAAANFRILDTRAASPLTPGRKITLALPGHGGIPATGAAAAVLNVAVLSAHDTGLLTIKDGDGSEATLHMRFLGNRTAPQSMQTERVVKVGSDGRLTFSQSSASSVQLVVDLMGYFLPGGVMDTGVSGGYIALNPQPIDGDPATPGLNPQIRLYQHRPLTVVPPVPDPEFNVPGFNLVLSPDQPDQPTLLGVYDPDRPWSGSVTLASTPARQPTELTVHTNVMPQATLVNLSSTTWTYLHGYVTGYYWHPFCPAGMEC